MKIFEFDILKGIYRFEFTDLNTESHSHPVVEFMVATQGTFRLTTADQTSDHLTFAIIDKNVEHQVMAPDCIAHIVMVESYNDALGELLTEKGLSFNAGVCLGQVPDPKSLLEKVAQIAEQGKLKTPKDPRVQQCLNLIEAGDMEYKTLLSSLTDKVHLSESRLSHLFKGHIGVSPKKYLVWQKLRNTIQLVLTKQMSLTEASLQAGFFDQAHFSNAFKQVLGVSPSSAYNSRIFQV